MLKSDAKLLAYESAIKLLINHINEEMINQQLAQKCIFKSLIPYLFCQVYMHFYWSEQNSKVTIEIKKDKFTSARPGHISEKKIRPRYDISNQLEDHWSCSSPERLSHCKLMRFKLIENRPMKVYAWTLLTPRAWPNLTQGHDWHNLTQGHDWHNL